MFHIPMFPVPMFIVLMFIVTVLDVPCFRFHVADQVGAFVSEVHYQYGVDDK